jgi:hypothetical protein
MVIMERRFLPNGRTAERSDLWPFAPRQGFQVCQPGGNPRWTVTLCFSTQAEKSESIPLPDRDASVRQLAGR